ncbi:copper-translocating P-type ATPase [Thermogymnomonas acidicola]|uniref:Copper-translocating P-type ATPase n=1 Tax=Thermogymnomonas acidicola TaxID=399579 RepID=A0AA37BPV5_9ARCH|nr:heavy metal translocating P-type ATPase [Thermogymnomonas acidicola]GGM68107.1 copper-translocating P-type ATPase [Thermogymnomonas acidicola]
MPTDPVCGMFVPEDSPLHVDRGGQRYYFCSKGCMEQFTSPERQVASVKRRLVLAWALAVPVISITYLTHFHFRDYVLLALSAPVQFYSGLEFYRGAYSSISSRMANMDLLVALGSTTAFAFSTAVTIFHSFLHYSGVYFDASTAIIALILTGSYVEQKAKERAQRDAEALIKSLPETAKKIVDGRVVEVPRDTLVPGDIIILARGDTVPADGEVVDGSMDVDASNITGEQEPVTLSQGDHVFSGSVVLTGGASVRLERGPADSTLMRVYEAVRRASMGRVRMQRVADIFSSVFVPVILAVAAFSFAFWFLRLGTDAYALQYAVLAAVSVLVIACPCAIGLAGPISFLIASSASYRRGILIRNPGALDRARKVTRVVFDKTGTLTEEEGTVSSYHIADGFPDALDVLYSVESLSRHPVARALCRFARSNGARVYPASSFREEPGLGARATVRGHDVFVGREGGDTVLKIDGRVAGRFSIEYRVRESAARAIQMLRERGISISMVTGDRGDRAEAVASYLGIGDVHHSAGPEEKERIVKEMQQSGEYVAFVGDGVNDAVAVSVSDVGIVIGGRDRSMAELGDIVIMNGDLRGIVEIFDIAESTLRKVRQNLAWAIVYNSILVPVAAGALVPLLGLGVYGYLPMFSALAMGMSSTSVVLNTLRLRSRIAHPRPLYKASPAH